MANIHPQSEWVVHDIPELRIADDNLSGVFAGQNVGIEVVEEKILKNPS